MSYRLCVCVCLMFVGAVRADDESAEVGLKRLDCYVARDPLAKDRPVVRVLLQALPEEGRDRVIQKQLYFLNYCSDLQELQPLGWNEQEMKSLGKLKNLKKLHTLNLTSVDLNAETVKNLSELPNLKYLVIPSGFANDIEQMGALFKACPKLEGLAFGEGELSNDAFKHLSPFKSLKALDFSECQLQDNALLKLEQRLGLESLNLRGKPLREEDFVRIGKLTQLKSLDLGGCEIDDNGLAKLKDLTKLRRLNISGGDVTNSGLKEIIAKFEELVHLDLSGNPVTASGIGRLDGLKKLQSLSLSGTGFVITQDSPLVKFQKLEAVDISGVSFRPDGDASVFARDLVVWRNAPRVSVDSAKAMIDVVSKKKGRLYLTPGDDRLDGENLDRLLIERRIVDLPTETFSAFIHPLRFGMD